jgi:hypothetical protein
MYVHKAWNSKLSITSNPLAPLHSMFNSDGYPEYDNQYASLTGKYPSKSQHVLWSAILFLNAENFPLTPP